MDTVTMHRGQMAEAIEVLAEYCRTGNCSTCWIRDAINCSPVAWVVDSIPSQWKTKSPEG